MEIQKLKQGRRIYYKSGTTLFEVWHSALCNNDTFLVEVEVYKNFKVYSKVVTCFEYKGKVYAIDGIDHFNGHFSNYRDKNVIYGVYLRKLESI